MNTLAATVLSCGLFFLAGCAAQYVPPAIETPASASPPVATIQAETKAQRAEAAAEKLNAQADKLEETARKLDALAEKLKVRQEAEPRKNRKR
jgi:outer membrane murein-binding lipoprotein Lpp